MIVRAVTASDWPSIEALFGTKGACGGCWCMWARLPQGGKLWEESKGEKNRRSFRRLVQSGQVHAVMAFEDVAPVGWCCFGPRRDFPRLARVRALQRDWKQDTWSIVCFYIHPHWRKQGVASSLLDAASAQALASGAREIEGYPVVSKSPGAIPAAFAWTGIPTLFRAAGYKQLPRQNQPRPIFLRTK